SGKYRDTLAITVQPDHGRYRDTLLVNGSLHADQIAYQEVRLFVDDRLTGTYRTDAKGAFTIPYTIEKITGGRHTLKAVRGAITSTAIPFVVLMDSTTTTLSAERTGSTAEVIISGRVNTTNRTVRDAPVTITWDGTHSLETRTDGNGVFRDSIILPAGTHRIQARFNRTDLYPLHPSNSTTVMINISPGLSLDVKPSSGTYKNPLTLQGTLVRPGSLEGTVNLFLDNQQIATTTTDRAGHYSHTLIIEQLPAGSHTVQVKTGDLASGVRTFTVLPAHSRTTLTVTPVNTSSLTTCNGTVMAFNRAGDVIRRPGNIRDVIALLPTLGRDPWSAATRPVSGAPVALIVNNERLLEMQTDEYGRFSCVVALPPGDNRISARFDATGFPLYPSQAKEHSVNIPSANTTPFVEEESSPVTAFVPVLVVAAILLLFTGGSVFYLKRRSLRFMTRRTTAETSAEDEARASAAEIEQEIAAQESYLAAVSPPDPAQVATDPLLARYIRILNAQGLSTAARAVYVHFTGTIAERLHIRRHRTLTPREFLGQCDKRSFTDTFSAFIAVYEQVRYGGIKTPAKENEFEESVKKTDESLGGDKD
ncbi:MAG: carboxypeptidase-like regulatory domain-containing protein, partial [Methanoregula sp.]